MSQMQEDEAFYCNDSGRKEVTAAATLTRQLQVSTSCVVSRMLRMADHTDGLCKRNSPLNKLEHVPVEGNQYILNE